MKYLSVCSGIEAATVAWEPLGWTPLAFSEIEPFPSAVLAHHWDVPNLGDFTLIERESIEQPDVLIGGTPCQAFSVAGLRQSLGDDRGNLTLEFVRLADRLDDGNLIIVWENVPGVLSTPDNAFGCFLGALVGNDTALIPTGKRWTDAGVVLGPTRMAAWRVLDAQYFGVAQRRSRVFVVASAREGFDPAAVLLERDGVCRDSAPSREPREGAAGGFECGPTGGRFTDLAPTLDTRAKDGPIRNQLGVGVAEVTVMAPAFSKRPGHQIATRDDGVSFALTGGAPPSVLGGGFDEPVAFADVSRTKKRQNGPGFTDSGVAFTLTVGDNPGVLEPLPFDTTQVTSKENGCNPQHGDPCHPITAQGHAPAIAFLAGNSEKAYGIGASIEHTPPLRAADSGTNQVPTIVYSEPITIRSDTTIKTSEGDVCHTLRVGGAGGVNDHVMTPQMVVRRLTPRECERLQGFPDDHTRIPYRNKPAEACPDRPRYKACGNSMAVPVIRWIGERIQQNAPARCEGVQACDDVQPQGREAR